MKWKEILVLLLPCVLFGCSYTRGAYNAASAKGTIQAYEEFLEMYPKSEYTSIVQYDIALLKKKKVTLSQQLYAANEPRFSKIQEYEVGVLSEEQFFGDDWNASDPWIGRIGIFKMSNKAKIPGGAEEEETVITLGICGIENESVAKVAQELFMSTKDAYLGGTPVDFALIGQTKGYPNPDEKYVPKQDISVYVCVLVFKDKVLTGKKMEFEEYTSLQPMIDGLLDRKY